jgi:hypothetical protein
MAAFLAPLIGLAISAIGSGVSAATTAKAAKKNKARMDELEKNKGLYGDEKGALQRSLSGPAAAAQNQAFQQSEAAAGLGAGQSLDTLANLRSQQYRAVGDMGSKVGQQMGMADVQRRADDKQEYERRLGMHTQRKADLIGGAMGAVGKSAAAFGNQLGAPPGMEEIAGPGGAQVPVDAASMSTSLQGKGWDADASTYVSEWAQRDYAGMTEALRATRQGPGTEGYDAYLAYILQTYGS